ncbi:tetratricopeptide repeat protein [Streptomyces sp. NPDC090022]|uniref:tetratricopeptide repeat protein n=1 Tax=Streptomyces sp. NPDC090022 TaxID=3365920 RepID=UPI0037F746CD
MGDTPGLAASLNNLSVRLSDLGQWEGALATVTEAVAVHRELARRRPDVHQRELDRSLWVLDWLEGKATDWLGRVSSCDHRVVLVR